MIEASERERILAVLYDLAITIGGEATVAGLTAKALQRFLYHTGYVAGFMAQQLDWSRLEDSGSAPVRLEMASGDPKLRDCVGSILLLPSVLLFGQGGMVEDARPLSMLPVRKPFHHALVLPLPGYGTMVLLSREKPRQDLHYSMFTPVLDRLASAITVCREQENQRDAFQRILTASIEQIPVSVLVTDKEGCIEYSNPAFSAHSGYALDEVRGKTPAFLQGGKTTQQEYAEIRQELAAGRVWKGEFHNLRKDGTWIWEYAAIAPLRDAAGVVTHYISIAEDITLRKEQEQRLRESILQLDTVLRQTVSAFSTATVHTDPYTAGHEFRVADMCVAMGRAMAFDDDRLLGLELAARTHDIGQIRIPAEILLRTNRLSDLEFEFVKLHVEAGWEILKTIDFPWPVAEIVLSHHENFDGSGYPRGLKGEDIMLEARILRVADAAESMSSHRPFRPAFKSDQVIDSLNAMKSNQLDPILADICIQLLRDGYVFPPPLR